jgi:putative type II/III system pilus formation protein
MNVSFHRFAFLACMIAFASIASAKAESVDIVLDRANLLKLPEKVATIVIGNPSVADGSLQAGGFLVVTGKGYGTTNLIALDARGNALTEYTLNVSAPKEGRVTIYRGVERETWSCVPNCERSIMLGDSQTYFDTAVGQIGTRNGTSTGTGTPTK